MDQEADVLAKLEHASKSYGTTVTTQALQPTDLELDPDEVTLLLGPSGSGKTTLLNLLGALDHPSTGRVMVAGYQLGRLSRGELTRFRRKHVGFVFQFFNLIPSLTAAENVQIAAELVDRGHDEAMSWLERVGLGREADRFPSELSGGQQQRVAVARALAKRPRILLADEPTGALDHDNGIRVIELLRDATRDLGCAVVVVTHDEELVRFARRVLRLRDGRIISDERTARA